MFGSRLIACSPSAATGDDRIAITGPMFTKYPARSSRAPAIRRLPGRWRLAGVIMAPSARGGEWSRFVLSETVRRSPQPLRGQLAGTGMCGERLGVDATQSSLDQPGRSGSYRPGSRCRVRRRRHRREREASRPGQASALDGEVASTGQYSEGAPSSVPRHSALPTEAPVERAARQAWKRPSRDCWPRRAKSPRSAATGHPASRLSRPSPSRADCHSDPTPGGARRSLGDTRLAPDRADARARQHSLAHHRILAKQAGSALRSSSPAIRASSGTAPRAPGVNRATPHFQSPSAARWPEDSGEQDQAGGGRPRSRRRAHEQGLAPRRVALGDRVDPAAPGTGLSRAAMGEPRKGVARSTRDSPLCIRSSSMASAIWTCGLSGAPRRRRCAAD